MLYAAKALGMTMVDIFKDSRLRDDIKREFDERIGEYEYDPFLDPGPPTFRLCRLNPRSRFHLFSNNLR